MTNEGEITYQSVLSRLSRIPAESLPEIDAYLETFVPENGSKASNREAVMSLAGSWGEMTDEDFQAFLHEARRSGSEAFDRDVSL